MKIGIIGSGTVGKTLAAGFDKYFFGVMIGSRSPEKLEQWKSESGFRGKIGTFDEVAKFGDIIVFAVKGKAASDVLKLLDPESLNGKTIIDTCNPIDDMQPPIDGVLKFFTRSNESLMEQLQALAPQAHFIKAFSCVGSASMVDPDFSGMKPTMFICGNDANAKSEVTKILDRFGWETEDMGSARAAGTIENLCILWCIPGFAKNDWIHAFKLLR